MSIWLYIPIICVYMAIYTYHKIGDAFLNNLSLMYLIVTNIFVLYIVKCYHVFLFLRHVYIYDAIVFISGYLVCLTLYPTDIGKLSHLTILDLDTNKLSGNIPSGYTHLSIIILIHIFYPRFHFTYRLCYVPFRAW